MDSVKIGKLIRSLRQNSALTQRELGDILHISDKTISKWETGGGIPAVDILPSLAKALGVTVDILLGGYERESYGYKKMNRTRFYVCPVCKNIFTSRADGDIYCHGIRLHPLKAENAEEHALLSIEKVDGEYLFTTTHEMSKDHYISFCAFVTYDRINVVSLYPEWHFNVRFPISRGEVYYYCVEHGLFVQKVR